MTKTFPVLYKKTSAGAIEQWRIWVETSSTVIGNPNNGESCYDIVTEHGQVGGKMQESHDTISEGKNLGKKNATTAVEQAVLEAEAKWRKKIERNGYVEDQARAAVGETDAEGGIAPMLAQPFEKVKKLKFPLLFQRKYNGIRCIATISAPSDEGVPPGVLAAMAGNERLPDVTLWSRKREQILCMPHVERALAAMNLPVGTVLDGELYVHGWTLQKIASYVRQKTEPKEGYEQVQYHVYDLPSCEDTNAARDAAREELLKDAQHPIVCVSTRVVYSAEEAWKIHDVHVQSGFEGGIGRRPDAGYQEGRRSPDLVKFKRFDETEFEVVDSRLGRGKYAGIPVLCCKTKDGGEFDCNPPGTLEERAAVDREKVIGKPLTVKHFGWSEDGLPLFPVGVAIRDYE